MEQKKVTLLVGAGAVENAWQPVINAIQEVTGKNVDASSANCLFAQSIYLARFYTAIDYPNIGFYLNGILNNLKLLKERICHNLKEAQKNTEIKARPELDTIISKFIILPRNKGVVVSTNWDTVVEDRVNTLYRFPDNKGIPCLHIHGDISSDIYLPSEITTEKYRTKEEDNNFGRKHAQLLNLLEKTDVLVIYGLSLSPLDAELLQIIYGIPNYVNHIIIINPNHNLVAKNILAIIDSNCAVKITGYCPLDLETKYNYR